MLHTRRAARSHPTLAPSLAPSLTLSLTRWLHEAYGTVVELYFAHGLCQSPLTAKSTGFDVHQVRVRVRVRVR